ncbi:MAG: hypothetical protein Kow0047_02000 [Anaerolineae bacterium]
MRGILFSPPVVFLIYIIAAAMIYRLGRVMAGPSKASPLKASIYASGEAPPVRPAAPGYRQFFVIALFFAVVHLGVLVIGTGGFSVVTAVYIAGLILALIALVLG